MHGRAFPARRSIFILSALALFLALLAPAILPAQSTANAPIATLPFELHQDHVFLTVDLVGHRPLTMILDTGASSTVLHRATLDELGLPYAAVPRARVQGAAGILAVQAVTAPIALDLDGARLDMPRAVALDFDALRRFRGRPLDGVLGADLFRRYIVEIDYAARRLSLHEPGSFHPHPMAQEVPLDVSGPIPRLVATLTTSDGRRIDAPFHLDSGAAASLVVTPRFAAEHGLLEAADGTLEISRHGVATRFKNVLARLDALDLGGAVIERPIAAFPQIEGGFFATTDAAGVIGASALKRFTVTLDYRGGRMLLLKNGGFDEPDRFITAGLELFAEGEAYQRIVVRGVIASSPAAESGILPGDRVIAVAGQDVSNLNLPKILDILSHDGQEVLVRLLRGDHILEAILVPRGLI